jgi:hypothetical protein
VQLNRIQKRRRITFAVGLLTMSLTAAAAVAFGSGCIFDEGGYDGGGRRTGAPTASDSIEAPPTETTPTSTSTSTSTPNDSGSPSRDTGALDN